MSQPRTATVVGLQWGDEGKGKVIDALASRADMVVRFQGGGNAGHTVVVDGKKSVFHLIPTGILYPNVICLVGNGTVVDLPALRDEITRLKADGVDMSGLRLSDRAHVVFPYHKALDEAREAFRTGGDKIGTTKRGIGPCYADKASRTGIRVCDLYAPERFGERLRCALDEKNAILSHLFRRPPLEYEPILKEYLQAAEDLGPYVADGAALLHDALANDQRILLEGAQGLMLDVDHGTYPFVTSSSASAAGASSGSGIPPTALGQVLGVAKAYTTRVGAGPFPTELFGEDGERLREAGHEYGATTGRPRRCGWLDLVQLGYAVRLSGTTGIVLTKLDTLAGLGDLQVVVGYKRGDQVLTSPPADEAAWEELEVVTETLPGIPGGIDYAAIREFDELPPEAKGYVAFIEERLKVPVAMVSTGPQRSALISRAAHSVFGV